MTATMAEKMEIADAIVEMTIVDEITEETMIADVIAEMTTVITIEEMMIADVNQIADRNLVLKQDPLCSIRTQAADVRIPQTIVVIVKNNGEFK